MKSKLAVTTDDHAGHAEAAAELKAFKELASNDNFGLKIRTSGGNIASRILPILIHELDPDPSAVAY